MFNPKLTLGVLLSLAFNPTGAFADQFNDCRDMNVFSEFRVQAVTSGGSRRDTLAVQGHSGSYQRFYEMLGNQPEIVDGGIFFLTDASPGEQPAEVNSAVIQAYNRLAASCPPEALAVYQRVCGHGASSCPRGNERFVAEMTPAPARGGTREGPRAAVASSPSSGRAPMASPTAESCSNVNTLHAYGRVGGPLGSFRPSPSLRASSEPNQQTQPGSGYAGFASFLNQQRSRGNLRLEGGPIRPEELQQALASDMYLADGASSGNTSDPRWRRLYNILGAVASFESAQSGACRSYEDYRSSHPLANPGGDAESGDGDSSFAADLAE